jgi:hypothetical protein
MPKASQLLSTVFMCLLAFSLHGCITASCTRIGCMDTITLTVTLPDGSQPTDIKGTVTVGGQLFEIDCTAESLCNDGIILIEVPPTEEIALNITSNAAGGLSFIGATSVTIDTFAPNGEGCGPSCTHGTATVTLEITQATP